MNEFSATYITDEGPDISSAVLAADRSRIHHSCIAASLLARSITTSGIRSRISRECANEYALAAMADSYEMQHLAKEISQ